MNSVSKVKIAVGYTLLLGVLFFSLFFVHQEMEHLMLSDNRDVQWTDSLITLLRKKDANTIYMLRVLSETNDSMVSTREIENIIATRQDSFVTNQRVQQRIITHRDTVVTKPRKKGFFRRLGEVFVPPKKDTAIQVKTSLEYATDTVINVYNPVDSLQEKLRAVAQQQKEHIAIVQRRRRTLQRMDRMLTARIDSLLKGYEQETLQRACEEAEYQQSVRHHSIKTISGIAVGAAVDGARAYLIETQALVSTAAYGTPQRSATGFDSRRLNMLLAVLEKRVGLKMYTKDVFLNFAGGFKISDTGLDMSVVAAILSSYFDRPLNNTTCFAGEIGLSGEIRPAPRSEQRISEAARLGFGRIIVSGYLRKSLPKPPKGIEIVYINKIEELARTLLGSGE